ncbi:hypothetical protein IQ07DRAFT_276417 [Pyrenochaeta sp. DS3sAY3a]|nr:hypothetical protein IQ07DRAFT_276417 [Pyrenochaeta sp. DS3sAY3a]
MRSFQAVIFFLCAFLACAFAQESEAYDATVYVTSTVYRVNTITLSGSPSAGVANQTSTISATHPTYGAGNATSTIVKPTGSQAQPSQPQFTGAASSLQANAIVAALVASVGYLVL